jgi:hypothetical protein
MAETFLIRGFWGSRAEGDAGLAERIGSLLGRLDALLPGRDGRWDLPKARGFEDDGAGDLHLPHRVLASVADVAVLGGEGLRE